MTDRTAKITTKTSSGTCDDRSFAPSLEAPRTGRFATVIALAFSFCGLFSVASEAEGNPDVLALEACMAMMLSSDPSALDDMHMVGTETGLGACSGNSICLEAAVTAESDPVLTLSYLLPLDNGQFNWAICGNLLLHDIRLTFFQNDGPLLARLEEFWLNGDLHHFDPTEDIVAWGCGANGLRFGVSQAGRSFLISQDPSVGQCGRLSS